jgi:hypothetical protein
VEVAALRLKSAAASVAVLRNAARMRANNTPVEKFFLLVHIGSPFENSLLQIR